MSHLFRACEKCKSGVRRRSHQGIVLASLGIGRWRAVHCNEAKCISLAEKQIAELASQSRVAFSSIA
jgi:hypothetical protein